MFFAQKKTPYWKTVFVCLFPYLQISTSNPQHWLERNLYFGCPIYSVFGFQSRLHNLGLLTYDLLYFPDLWGPRVRRVRTLLRWKYDARYSCSYNQTEMLDRDLPLLFRYPCTPRCPLACIDFADEWFTCEYETFLESNLSIFKL